MGRILHFLLKAIFILCIQIILASECCKCSEPLPSHQQCIFLGSDLYKYLVKNDNFEKDIKIKIDDFFGKLLESLLRYNKKKSVFKLDTTSEEIKQYKRKKTPLSDKELYENIAIFIDRNTINSSRMEELYKEFRELNELRVKTNDEKYEELKKTIEELKNKLTINEEVCNKSNTQNNSETQKDIDNKDSTEDEEEDETSIKKLDLNADKEKSKDNKSNVEDENIEDIVLLQTKFFTKHLNTSFEDLRKTLIYIYKTIKNSKNNKIEFSFSNVDELLAFKNKMEIIYVILNKIIKNVILTNNNICLENYFNILQDNANLFNVIVKSISNSKKEDSLKFVMQEEFDVIKESAEKLKLFIDLCVEIPKIESKYIKKFPEISLKIINVTIAGYFIDLMDFFINSKNDLKFIDYINKNRNDIESFLTKLKEISETNSVEMFKKLEKDVEEFFKNNKGDCNLALMGLQLFSIPSELNSTSFYYFVADEYMINATIDDNESYFYDEYIMNDYPEEVDYVIYNDLDGVYQDFYANSELAYQENFEFYDPNQQFPEYDNGEDQLQDDNTLKNSGENNEENDDEKNSATQEQENLNDVDGTEEGDESEEAEGTEDAEDAEGTEDAEDSEGTEEEEEAEGTEDSEDAEGTEDAEDSEGTEEEEEAEGTEDSEDAEGTDEEEDVEDAEDVNQEEAEDTEDVNQEEAEDTEDANQEEAEDAEDVNQEEAEDTEDVNQEEAEDTEDVNQEEAEDVEDVNQEEADDANQEDQMDDSDGQQQVEDDGSPNEDAGGEPEDSNQEDQMDDSDGQQQVEDDGSQNEDVGGEPEDSAQGDQENDNSSEGEQENVSPDHGEIQKNSDSEEDNQNNHDNVKNTNDDTAQESDESNRTQYNKVNTQEEDNKSDSESGNEESQNLETNNVASTHSQNNKNDFEQNFDENQNQHIRTSKAYEADEQEEEKPAHKKYFNSIFHKNVENFTHKDLLRAVNYFAKKHRKNNINNKLSTFCDKQRIYSWEF